MTLTALGPPALCPEAVNCMKGSGQQKEQHSFKPILLNWPI